jgi:hypothetical protein
MNVLLLGALVALTGGTEDSVERSDDWLDLDKEITSLVTTLDDSSAPAISGFLRARYVSSSDFLTGGEDTGGFDIQNVRLSLIGQSGDYGYKIQMDGAGGTYGLLDAKMWWNCGEQMKVTMGRFKNPFDQSYVVSANHLMFLDRTMQGMNSFSTRDLGIMLSGDSAGVLRLRTVATAPPTSCGPPSGPTSTSPATVSCPTKVPTSSAATPRSRSPAPGPTTAA